MTDKIENGIEGVADENFLRNDPVVAEGCKLRRALRSDPIDKILHAIYPCRSGQKCMAASKDTVLWVDELGIDEIDPATARKLSVKN